MIEDRDLFERAVQRFAPSEGSFDRLIALRDRKRRNQRIAAGVVGIAIALGVAFIGARLLRSESTPADWTPAPSSVRNGEFVMVRGTFWSPDTDPELIAVDPDSGAVRHLATCDQECGVLPGAWSPSGTDLLFSTGGRLRTLDMETGSSRSLVPGRAVGATFSPDGERILYDAGMPPTTPTDVVLARSDGGGGRSLGPLAGMNLPWSQWSPDGRSIAYFDHGVHFSDGAIGILRLGRQPVSRTFVSFPRADPCNTPSAPLGCVHSVTMSPVDGRIAYATFDPAAGTDTVRVIDPDSGEISVIGTWRPTARPDQLPSRMAWSPDGSRIAYVEDCRFWLIAPDGTNRTLIGDLGACMAVPDQLAWSPDGTELAFYELGRDAEGVLQEVTLTVLPLDEGQVRRLATFEPDDSVGLQPLVWRPIP